MMNEEEKFDDLLRDKLSEREFFFDEENWQKLNEKIDATAKIRKQTRFGLTLLGGILLGVAVAVPVTLIITKNANKEKTIANSNTEGSTTSSGAVTSPQTAAANNPNSTGEATAQMPIANKSATDNAVTENANVNGPVANNSTSQSGATAPSAPVNNETKADETTKSQRGNNASFTTNGSVNTASYVRPSARNINSRAASLNANSPKATVNAGRNTYASANNRMRNSRNNGLAYSTSSSNTQNRQSADNSSTRNNSAANSTLASNDKPVQANNNSQTNSGASQTNTAIANNVAANQAATQTTANNSQTNQQSSGAVQSNTNDSNQIAQSSNEPAPPIKTPALIKASNILSVDAGAGYSLGWKNYGITEANGISPVFGVTIGRFLSSELALTLSIQYNSLNNLKTSYSNTTTTYDFGANANNTTVTPQTVHYLALPLTLRYYFDDNDALCLGGSFLYLVNTSSKVISSTQNELNPATSSSSTTLGYTQGFSNIDLQARIAYRRRIYKGFAASLEAYFGLLDDENTFFADNTFKRNSGLRMILSWDFIK